jgi:hypothetical protein
MKAQVELNASLLKSVSDLLEGSSFWSVTIAFCNYGSGPMIIHPEGCELWIRGKGVGPYTLPGDLVIAKRVPSGDATLEKSPTVVVMPPGKIALLMVVCQSAQRDLSYGKTLRGAFTDGTASIRARLKYSGGELPWKWSLKTKSVPFKSSIAQADA